MVTADDDRTVRAMIQSMFEAHAQVIMAEDGKSALEAVEKYKPDLLLLDDTMPAMTGLRLAEKLKADYPALTTHIIMLTASDRPQDRERAEAAGVMDYIMKPFDPYQLSAQVWQTLARIVR
jgi:CheY-like chemotaxis protein